MKSINTSKSACIGTFKNGTKVDTSRLISISILVLAVIFQAEFPRVSHARVASPAAESQLILANTPSNGEFGTSVDISGNTLVVGAPNATDAGGVARGVAFIYTNDSGSWQFQTRLEAPAGAPGFSFGFRVAIQGDTMLIGGTPAVYVYGRNAGQWTLQQTLSSPETGPTGGGFGSGVAVDGNTIIIGASVAPQGGAAFVFERQSGQWVQTARFDDPTSLGGQFGTSVDVSGDTIAVGDPFAGIGGTVFVFRKIGKTWNSQGLLTGSDSGDGDQFGRDVAIEGETLVVGAESYTTTGAAYVLLRNAGVWTEQQKLLTPPGFTGSSFGCSVDISGDRIVIGDRRETLKGTFAGAAYAFAPAAGGNWVLQNRLIASDRIGPDFFGTDVAVDGRRYVAGAPRRDFETFPSAGAVYYFTEAPGSPDLRTELDTGSSSSDNITNIQDLVFDVSGLTPGTTVELLRNGTVVDSEVVVGTTAVMTDTPPHNNTYQYTTRHVIGGQPSSLSDVVVVTVDNTAPVAFIAQGPFQEDPIRQATCDFRIYYNEPITGFNIGDVSFAGSTANLTNATITHTNVPASDTLTVANIVSDGQIVRASLPAGSVIDLAGNPNNFFQPSDDTVLIDNVRPTVTVNQSSSQADPTTSQPLRYTAVFSEPVTGFTPSDVSVTSQGGNVTGRIVEITGSGANYEVRVSNLSLNGFPVHVRVGLFAAQDSLANTSLESTSTDNIVTLDNVGPTASVAVAPGQPNPTASGTVNFRVAFNEAVTGFDASDVSLSASTANVASATVTVTGSGTTYNVAVGNITSDRQVVRVNVLAGAVSDAPGNPSTASTGNASITVDNVAPTVAIDQAIGQTDPATVQPVNFMVIFSEPVTGLTAADISLAGSTANVSVANIVITGSSDIWNVAVSNIISSGEVRASVVANAVADALGNLSAASHSTDNKFDLVVPASASISGRVTNTSGRGLARVRIEVLLSGGERLYALTNPFGYYHLINIPTGQVTITAGRKGGQPASTTFYLLADAVNTNFSFL